MTPDMLTENENKVVKTMLAVMTEKLGGMPRRPPPTEIAHCFALACERCDFIATEESANRILQAVAAQLVDLTATVDRLKARRRGEVHAKKPAEKLAAGESVP